MLGRVVMQAAILERWLEHPPLTTDQRIMAREDNVCTHEVDWPRFGIIPRRFQEGIRAYL